MFIYNVFMFFFIYGCLGWFVEVAFIAIHDKKLLNTGFLNGPFCPIYGIALNVLIILLSTINRTDIVFLFFSGAVVSATLELFVGWILYQKFHMRWWDYREERFNFKGYICLKFTFMWGFSAVIFFKYAHPLIAKVEHKIPYKIGMILLIIFSIITLLDFIVTYKEVVGISRSLGEIEHLTEAIKEISDKIANTVGGTAMVASDAVVTGKDKVTDTVVAGKDKVTETMVAGKDKVTETMVAGKDKVTETMVAGKDKVTETMVAGKNKVTGTVLAGKEKVVGAIQNYQENASEKVKLENIKKEDFHRIQLQKEKDELEKKYKMLAKSLQKQSGRLLRAFPRWDVSGAIHAGVGKTKKMSDYIMQKITER